MPRWLAVALVATLLGAVITGYTRLDDRVAANTEELARRSMLTISIPLALDRIQQDVNAINDRLARIEQRLGIPR